MDLLIDHEKNFGGGNTLTTLSQFIEKKHYLTTISNSESEEPRLLLEDDPVEMIAQKSSYYQLSISSFSEISSQSSKQDQPVIKPSARKRFQMSEVDFQPSIPGAKRPATFPSKGVLPPAIQEAIHYLGEGYYDGPLLHIDLLMKIIAQVNIPQVLMLKNPPLNRRR